MNSFTPAPCGLSNVILGRWTHQTDKYRGSYWHHRLVIFSSGRILTKISSVIQWLSGRCQSFLYYLNLKEEQSCPHLNQKHLHLIKIKQRNGPTRWQIFDPFAQRPKGGSFKTIITETQVLFHAERDTETKLPTRCKDFKSQKLICLISWIKMFMFF